MSFSNKEIKITNLHTWDVRFPTSKSLDGSDAMNSAPDYSAAYVEVQTNIPSLSGHGMTFTIGRGNEICKKAIESLKPLLVGCSLNEITDNMAGFWRQISGDSQLRWVGPEKGVIHLATAAVVNGIWDLWARQLEKPLWKLVSDMSPEQLVSCIDFRYITDALKPEEALHWLKEKSKTKAQREKKLLEEGYPAYTTSAGWLGYDDDKIRRLTREAVNKGWKYFKIKVGGNIEDDIRRLKIVREEIGPDKILMIDANQVWDVDVAIDWVSRLKEFSPWFIEEPTSPDDILGHLSIKKGISPVKIATGEHCHNRVMFKQFFQSGALDVCQLDSCRLGGVNEVLAVLLMAAKYKIPVCPHAGGVGLAEHVQHLSMIDYLCISGTHDGRVIEYVDHLHDHFVNPCIVKNGHYLAPEAPGFSTKMKPSSIEEFSFPIGEAWKQ